MPLSLSPSLLMSSASSVAFSPLSLFASGEQGAWYDPSDLTTMFQDTAGTTPVTATGQTVGLLLDKSKGLVLGPELVTNGDFAVDANWTKGAGWIISGGQASITSAAANSDLTQSISLTVGNTYLVSFTYTASAAFNAWLGSSGSSFTTSSGTGTVSRYVVAAAGGDIRFRAGTGVSLVIDNVTVKELPGNHATQATAASRPIYGIEPFGGRRNLLTYTEQFDNAVWVLQAAGVGVAPTRTLNAGTSPAGVTACRLQFSLGGGTTTTDQSIFRQSTTVPAGAGVFSVWLRSTDGVSSYVMQLTDPSGSGQNITVTGSWQRFQVSGTSAGTAVNYQLRLRGGQTPANSNTADVLFSEPQVEPGSTATAYQRVTDQWNVTQAGVPSVSYLAFDGTDDFLLTGTITPGIDKAQVFAGVRKLSDANGTIVESSVNSGSNSGAFGLFGGGYGGAAAAYAANLYGSQRTSFDATTFAAPTTNTLTSLFDIDGANRADEIAFRVNGVTPTLTGGGNTGAGTGNFLAYPLYVGRRGGNLQPFNGRIYGLAVRFGANLSAAQISQMETWLNARTGAF